MSGPRRRALRHLDSKGGMNRAGSSRIPILFMAHALGHGGGERQLALIALNLDRERFEPHVACCEGGFWAEVLENANIPVFFIRSRSLMSGAAFKEALRLRTYLREHGIRILQTFDYSMNVFGIPVALSVPGVVAISNQRCFMDLIPARYRWLNRFAHRFSDAVVANSNALREHLRRDGAAAGNKIFVCHNGLDIRVFHDRDRRRIAGLEDAELVIGCVSVLRPEKRLDLLVDCFAASAARHPGIRLLLVGSGSEEAALRDRARQAGIAGRCVFVQATPHVTPYLSSIDIFVLPSMSEGLSNSLMEAMACGCCVIASDTGGNAELIQEGVDGLLFPPGDAAWLGAQLETAIASEGLRTSLAAAAARRIRSQFSLINSVERMQAIYSQILSANRPSIAIRERA
jgi:glycosyltransferase involved in cell wall biosynthesis